MDYSQSVEENQDDGQHDHQDAMITDILFPKPDNINNLYLKFPDLQGITDIEILKETIYNSIPGLININYDSQYVNEGYYGIFPNEFQYLIRLHSTKKIYGFFDPDNYQTNLLFEDGIFPANTLLPLIIPDQTSMSVMNDIMVDTTKRIIYFLLDFRSKTSNHFEKNIFTNSNKYPFCENGYMSQIDHGIASLKHLCICEISRVSNTFMSERNVDSCCLSDLNMHTLRDFEYFLHLIDNKNSDIQVALDHFSLRKHAIEIDNLKLLVLYLKTNEKEKYLDQLLKNLESVRFHKDEIQVFLNILEIVLKIWKNTTTNNLASYELIINIASLIYVIMNEISFNICENFHELSSIIIDPLPKTIFKILYSKNLSKIFTYSQVLIGLDQLDNGSQRIIIPFNTLKGQQVLNQNKKRKFECLESLQQQIKTSFQQTNKKTKEDASTHSDELLNILYHKYNPYFEKKVYELYLHIINQKIDIHKCIQDKINNNASDCENLVYDPSMRFRDFITGKFYCFSITYDNNYCICAPDIKKYIYNTPNYVEGNYNFNVRHVHQCDHCRLLTESSTLELSNYSNDEMIDLQTNALQCFKVADCISIDCYKTVLSTIKHPEYLDTIIDIHCQEIDNHLDIHWLDIKDMIASQMRTIYHRRYQYFKNRSINFLSSSLIGMIHHSLDTHKITWSKDAVIALVHALHDYIIEKFEEGHDQIQIYKDLSDCLKKMVL